MSDYEDGAFYWVRYGGKWTPAERDDRAWHVPGCWDTVVTSELDEIGPCIGKEPPVSPRITVTAPPALGTAEVIRGSVRYTPATGRVGKDGFTWTAV